MTTLTRDPEFIAQRFKLIRKVLGLTQEALAAAADLSTRTIEKAESGRHCPQEQTLMSICRITGMEMSIFDKPTPAQEARDWQQIERALSERTLVATRPVRSTNDFMKLFGQTEALAFDASAAESESVLELAASIRGHLEELNEAWDLMNASERLSNLDPLLVMISELEAQEHLLHLGRYRQQLVEVDDPIIFTITFASIQPKDESDGDRYALIEVADGWEVPEEDRPRFD